VLIGTTVFPYALRNVRVSPACRSCSVLMLEAELRLIKLDELAKIIIRINKTMKFDLKAKIERTVFRVQFIRK